MTDPQDRPTADDEAGAARVPVSEPEIVEATVASADDPVPQAPDGEAPAEGDAAVKTASTRRRTVTPTRPAPVSSYAIIETGGKQYRVSVGDSLAVERLAHETGGDVTIDRVLLLGGNGTTRVGTPTVAGATVTARVDDHYRGEKIVVFKYKAKKRYRRRMGHRQSLTRLTITGIAG